MKKQIPDKQSITKLFLGPYEPRLTVKNYRINVVFLKYSHFFSDVSMAPDNSGLIYAVGSDKTIKQFKESQATKEIDLHTITLSTVVLSHEGTMLFTGSTTGTLYRLEQ